MKNRKFKRRSTGVRDINGIIIREGDILDRIGSNHNGVVSWRDDREGGEVGFCITEPSKHHNFWFSTSDYKIIGNIYDNPKLQYRWGRS